MKKYLAVFTGSAAPRARWDALPESERQQRTSEGVSAWKNWVSANEAHIMEIGGPLGKTKLVGRTGTADVSNNLAGFTVVRAESHEAASKLFLQHPHFRIFPGDGVEVMEIRAIPEEL